MALFLLQNINFSKGLVLFCSFALNVWEFSNHIDLLWNALSQHEVLLITLSH